MTTGKTIALTILIFVHKIVSTFYYTVYICLIFSSKEEASFNLMAVVTVHSDFGAQQNKVCHCFHISIYHDVMGLDAMISDF